MRIAVDPTSLTQMTRELIPLTQGIADAGVALGRADVPDLGLADAGTVEELLTVWAAALARLADRVEAFGGDTFAAGALYERTDRTLAQDWAAAHPPPPPPPPPSPPVTNPPVDPSLVA